jgi:Ni/Fe-hydrogenase subunit HybB-like protein
MVIFETTIATTSLKLEGEMNVIGPLSRFTIFLLGVYILLKLGDMAVRGTYTYLFDGSVESFAFMAEVLLGVLVPWVMLLFGRIRRSRRWLFIACTLIVIGVAVNRINVFLVSYSPPYATQSYFPALGEIAVTAGLIAAIIFLYRVLVIFLPVLSAPKKEGTT